MKGCTHTAKGPPPPLQSAIPCRNITAVQHASALLAKAHEWECLNAWSEVNAATVSLAAAMPCYDLSIFRPTLWMSAASRDEWESHALVVLLTVLSTS